MRCEFTSLCLEEGQVFIESPLPKFLLTPPRCVQFRQQGLEGDSSIFKIISCPASGSWLASTFQYFHSELDKRFHFRKHWILFLPRRAEDPGKAIFKLPKFCNCCPNACQEKIYNDQDFGWRGGGGGAYGLVPIWFHIEKLGYHIYLNKRRGAYSIFRDLGVVLIRGQHLIKGDACLKSNRFLTNKWKKDSIM